MSTGGYTIDQLMELAGLSVSQAVYRLHPPRPSSSPSKHNNILIACGPGNNGGDGLVAARHLFHYGYTPRVYYPKPTKKPLFDNLTTQLRDLDIPFCDDFGEAMAESSFVVDAVFGFSFKGEVRAPFDKVVEALEQSEIPVLAVDSPSSWNIDDGPPQDGPGSKYNPDALISLTAPKPLVKWFKGRHFVGGRFLSKKVADRFGIDVPEYEGIDQVVEVKAEGQKE
jgi:NAD(P)H-hydrate epimerase